MVNNLRKTLAKLRLKELEMIDRLSDGNGKFYVIRCEIDPNTLQFKAVNGDWERVTGFTESQCVGKEWPKFLQEEDRDKALKISEKARSSNEFESSEYDLIKSSGEIVHVRWKSKYYATIGSILSIGKIPIQG